MVKREMMGISKCLDEMLSNRIFSPTSVDEVLQDSSIIVEKSYGMHFLTKNFCLLSDEYFLKIESKWG